MDNECSCVVCNNVTKPYRTVSSAFPSNLIAHEIFEEPPRPNINTFDDERNIPRRATFDLYYQREYSFKIIWMKWLGKQTTYLNTRLQDFGWICRRAAGSGIAFGPVDFGSKGAPPRMVSINSYRSLNVDDGPYRWSAPLGFGMNSIVISELMLK